MHLLPAWIKLALPVSEDKFIFEVALRDLREKEARAKKSNEKRNCFTSFRLTPLSFKEEEKTMRNMACHRLSESWIEETKKQGADHKVETNLERLRGMWQLRLKWKSTPTFSTWLEVQDPIHRHSWTPVNLNRDNLFDHYDFSNMVPDPLTRTRAENSSKPSGPLPPYQ